jgi:hypothetical protein
VIARRYVIGGAQRADQVAFFALWNEREKRRAPDRQIAALLEPSGEVQDARFGAR